MQDHIDAVDATEQDGQSADSTEPSDDLVVFGDSDADGWDVV
jgi:hypothetical protein